MRGHRTLWRAAFAPLAALAVALSAGGCNLRPSESELPTASEAVGSPTAAPAPDAGAPSPTPTEVPRVTTREVHTEPLPRVITKEVHDHISTPCFPGFGWEWWHSSNFVQWTPDGSTILFTHGPRFYAVAADGSRLWQLAEPTHAGVAGAQVGKSVPFTIAPDSEQVIYATCAYPHPQSTTRSTEDYGYELALVQIDGGAKAGLTESRGFDSHKDNGDEVAAAQPARTEPVRLTKNRGFDNYPAWSPDGTRIAFLASSGESTQRMRLYSMAADGTDVRPISTGPGDFVHQPPQWSPDGQRLAFVLKDAEGNPAIHTVAATGAGRKRLTEAVSGPSWSPNGQRLAYAKRVGGEAALYTIAVDGSDERQVVRISDQYRRRGDPGPTPDWIETVAWSPDGSKILYRCGKAICVVTPDGTRLGTSPAASSTSLQWPSLPAAWAPDSSQIAVVNLGRLGTADGPMTVLATMAPDRSDAQALVWATDGERLVLARQG